MGRTLGDPDDPLLVSVRSGAAFSMPGMMETVLNIGLNDESVAGLARQSEDERFAMDSYRRLLQMFGGTVLGIHGEHFSDALDAAKDAKGVTNDLDLDVDDLKALIDTFKGLVREHAGIEFPQDPREQMDRAIRAVFDSWNTDRAVLYRRQERIPEDLGTAVNIQAMVFGNRGMTSGSGVCFTRDPASGDQGVYGDYLQNAQGEDVVAGIRNTVSLADMADIDKASHDQLLEIMSTLEHHYRDMCDIEFTVELGKLWMLQTRVGKRTPEAAFRIAVHMVDEGLIDMDEALRRVNGEQLANLMFPRFDTSAEKDLLAVGMNASPGAAVGKAVFDWATAVEWTEQGEDVILVRKETTPEDLHGMMVAKGVLTSRGGKTSHAAVVARGMGRTCVCGAESLDVDTREGEFTVRGGKTDRRGRRHLDRRLDRRGLRRRGAGRRLLRRTPLRGQAGRRAARRGGHPADGPCRLQAPVGRAHQRRHGRGRRARPPVRRPGHRAVPHRAHVPGRAAPARREPHRRRRRGGPGGRARRAAGPAAAGLPRRSSRRWTGCR